MALTLKALRDMRRLVNAHGKSVSLTRHSIANAGLSFRTFSTFTLQVPDTTIAKVPRYVREEGPAATDAHLISALELGLDALRRAGFTKRYLIRLFCELCLPPCAHLSQLCI